MSTDVRTAARRLTRRGHDVFARATEKQRVLPNFLIVGGQRCGTTTLFKTLLQHPGVLGPSLRKGVHYFDLAYEQPLSWYRSHFPSTRRVSGIANKNGYAAAVGESSPYYLWHPCAIDRINRDLPDVRLLVLLRDPVERAYSAHAHELARGFETESFEIALELEVSRVDGAATQLVASGTARSTSHQHHAYVQRGEYVDQLEQTEKIVGRDRMLVIDSQDFWSNPESVWPSITEFLSIPDAPVSFERHNARSRAPMPDSLRQRLAEHFEPFDERLAAWWDRTPSWRQ